MRTECRLTIHCMDAVSASQLGEVLAPDNVGMPRDQRFSMSKDQASLVFRVEAKSLASLSSAVISILRDAALFQEIWLLSRGKDAAVGRQS